MIYQAHIDRWFNNQSKFTVNHVPAMGVRTELYILRDLTGKFDINVFDSEAEAREFAYQMVHGVLHKEDQDKVENMDVRSFLVETAQAAQDMLASDDLCKRHIDAVGAVYETCRAGLLFEGVHI